MSIINFGSGLRAELHWDPKRDLSEIYLKEFTSGAKYGFKVRIPLESLIRMDVVPFTRPDLKVGDNDYNPHLAMWAFPFKHRTPIESCGETHHIEELHENSYIVIIQLRQVVRVNLGHRSTMQAIEFKTITGPIDKNIRPNGVQSLHKYNDFRLPYYEKLPRGGEYPEVTLELLHSTWGTLEEIGVVPMEEGQCPEDL